MSKFYGFIGYAEMKETAPGVWQEVITERNYYGDVLRLSSKLKEGSKVNPDISIDHQISVVADPFACEHFAMVRYVKWMNSLWRINSVEVQRPRLILSVGGVYNDQTLRTP